MRTKTQILKARLAAVKQALNEIEAELKWAEATPFTVNGTGQCSKCGTPLPTELDFWDHFVVPDERFINLGQCPNK